MLKNSSAVFIAAMILGLLFPHYAQLTKDLIIPVLSIIMTLSLSELDFGVIKLRDSLFNVCLNYIYLSGLILLLSFVLIDDRALWLGFVVMAAAPPAVAVVPFTRLLGGDVAESLISSGVAYILSLFITPAIILALTGEGVDTAEIFKALLILVLLPIVVSRFFKIKNRDLSTSLINLGFGVVVYSIVGINSGIITNITALWGVLLIGLARTLVSGSVVLVAFSRLSYEKLVPKILFSSYKNLGFTAGISILLFGSHAAIPAAVCSIFEVLAFAYFSTLLSKIRQS